MGKRFGRSGQDQTCFRNTRTRPGFAKIAFRVLSASCLVRSGRLALAVGIAGGILIGIYLYHGGPDGVECVCNNGQNAAGTGSETTLKPDVTTTPNVETTVKPGNMTTTEQYTAKITTAPKCKTCPRRDPVIPQDDPELFKSITTSEAQQIRTFMIKEGLISDQLSEKITVATNFITGMDISDPLKEKALAYLDKGGEFPERFARVTVNRGARDPPDCMVYLIGPLGGNLNATQLYADGEISFEARPISYWDVMTYEKLLEPLGKTLEPLTRDSFDGAIFADDSIRWYPYNGQAGTSGKDREIRLSTALGFNRQFIDYHLLDMLPLSAVMHCPGNNISTYYVHSIYYLNQGPFNSSEDLLDAYNNGSLRKVKLPKGYRDTLIQRMYIIRDVNSSMRAFADLPPPRTYEPVGPRYTVKGNQVKWMGWQLDVTSRMMRGAAIFDVRYKGERIAYEISLNEISLIYSSDSFDRSNMVYTDSTYGIGYYSGTVKAVDCPEHATYLETRYYEEYSGTIVTAKSICVFEADGEEAVWRHKYSTFEAGMRSSYLVIRASAVIGNYDYITEYQFHLDGKLFTKAKATGFLQSGFWDEDNPNRGNAEDRKSRDMFGFKVSDRTHGLIHDHMFSFKVDLDIIDTNNSMEVIHVKSGDALEAFKSQNPAMTKKPDYFAYDTARYLQFETIEKEQGFRLDLENQKFYTVVNENYRNHWGVKRGYQIYLLGTVLQSMANNHPAMQALSFSKYTCAVTKRKDSEPFSSSIFDAMRFDNARGDLDKQLNNETIRNEDLTTWITVGFFHVPTSEDVPMTLSLETEFLLKPFNFFDKTDVFDMPQYYSTVFGYTENTPDFEPCEERKED